MSAFQSGVLSELIGMEEPEQFQHYWKRLGKGYYSKGEDGKKIEGGRPVPIWTKV
jgi:hypothetical protein